MKCITVSLKYQAMLAKIVMHLVQRLKLCWSMDFPTGQLSQSTNPNLLKLVQGSVVECSWVACSVFIFQFHWKYLVKLKERSTNMKTKYYQGSGIFFRQEMGRDCSREVSEDSVFREVIKNKRFCSKFDFWGLYNFSQDCLEPFFIDFTFSGSLMCVLINAL